MVVSPFEFLSMPATLWIGASRASLWRAGSIVEIFAITVTFKPEHMNDSQRKEGPVARWRVRLSACSVRKGRWNVLLEPGRRPTPHTLP